MARIFDLATPAREPLMLEAKREIGLSLSFFKPLVIQMANDMLPHDHNVTIRAQPDQSIADGTNLAVMLPVHMGEPRR